VLGTIAASRRDRVCFLPERGRPTPEGRPRGNRPRLASLVQPAKVERVGVVDSVAFEQLANDQQRLRFGAKAADRVSGFHVPKLVDHREPRSSSASWPSTRCTDTTLLRTSDGEPHNV
jgi:hypothetical protein